jgi:hypothetical protein
MFNVYSVENQNFYLNNSLVSGIEDLSISYGNNINPYLSIDSNDINYSVSAPIIANLDLNYILSSNDPFISYTGNNSFSGKIEYGNKFFTFSSGYLNNYSIEYRLNEYPKVNVRTLLLGELGNTSGIFNFNPKPINNFNIGDSCYVDLNLNEANFNRLESFGLNIDINRIPIYTIGNYLPDSVIIKYPINISLNFEFSMSDYDQEKVTNIFNNLNQRNLTLSFKKYQTNESLLTFNLSNLINSSTQLKYSLNDDAKLTLFLNTYILSGI